MDPYSLDGKVILVTGGSRGIALGRHPATPRLVGLARAKGQILLGDLIDAATAMMYGLVNRVVPPGMAENAAGELAGTPAERGPVAVREAKALLDAALDRPLDESPVQALEASERVFSTDDMLEGSTAFLEKRRPRFDDR